MKAYTDLEQSKKLAKILPLESADMSYSFDFDSGIYEISTTSYKSWVVPKYAQPDNGFGQVIPCWSLAALLSFIRELIGYEVLCLDRKTITIKCELGDKPWSIEVNKSNEIDACVEMIIKLHK